MKCIGLEKGALCEAWNKSSMVAHAMFYHSTKNGKHFFVDRKIAKLNGGYSYPEELYQFDYFRNPYLVPERSEKK